MKLAKITRRFSLLALLGAPAAPTFARAQVTSCPLRVADPPAPTGRSLLEQQGVSLPSAGDFSAMPNVEGLRLEAGHRYVIETFGLSAGTDTVIELRRAANGTTSETDAVVAENDDRPGSLASSIEWEADRSGSYYVHVRPYDENSGGMFNIRVTDTGAGNPQSASNGPVVLTEQGLSLTSEQFETLPNIELSRLVAGRTYAVETFDLSPDADTIVEVRRLGSSGTPSASDEIVAANDDVAEGTFASRLEWTADQNGSYYLHVRPYGPPTGTFNLRVTQLR